MEKIKRTIKTVWITSDGKEWTDQASARRAQTAVNLTAVIVQTGYCSEGSAADFVYLLFSLPGFKIIAVGGGK